MKDAHAQNIHSRVHIADLRYSRTRDAMTVFVDISYPCVGWLSWLHG